MSEQASITNPTSGGFRILGETNDLLVVEKPPFLLIHPSKLGDPVTLWDRLKELLAYEIASGGQVSLINRLDRETSGIVLVAKNAAAARICGMTMARGEVKKEYQAIVTGWPEREQWEIREPILRLGEVQDARIWLKRGVHSEGAPSHTAFRVLKRVTHREHGQIALIHCTPFTGKTHQIRIHLAHSGYPVVGDKIYGPSEECYLKFIETGWTAELAARLWIPRHALHSCLLELDYLGQTHCWESPLSDDLIGLLKDVY